MNKNCEYNGAPIGPCEGEVKIRKAMTAYHFEGCPGSPEDPNRDFSACEGHWEAYRSHWQEQWDEYYSEIRAGIADSFFAERRVQIDDRFELENERYLESIREFEKERAEPT